MKFPYYGKLTEKSDKKITFTATQNKTKSFSRKGTAIDQLMFEIGGLVSMSGLLSDKQLGDIRNIIKRDNKLMITKSGNVFFATKKDV